MGLLQYSQPMGAPPGPTAAPSFSPPAGLYASAPTVTINDATFGALIFYTTDGSTPTYPTTGTTQLYTGPFTVAQNETVQAIAIAVGFGPSLVSSAAYQVQAPPPFFSPVAGTYAGPQNVTIADLAPGASIFFTTDGSTPTTGSTPYTTPINVAVNETLKAIATAPGFAQSPVGSAAYVISGLPQAATPTFSPVAGTYTGTQSVTISCSTPSSNIFYTTDGSTPTTGSTPYTGPVSVAVSETLKAIATAAGFSQSNVGTAAYVINAPPPVVPAQQMKFFSGFLNMSEGYQFSTIYSGGTGPTGPGGTGQFGQGGYLYDIAMLAANQSLFLGNTYGFLAHQFENYSAATNLALVPAASGGAAGATGAALQTAIVTQYPGVLNFEKAFYTQQATVFGSLMGAIFNFQQINHPNITSPVMTGSWPNAGILATPADTLNAGSGSLSAGGVLTVPTAYGATTTQTFQQAPIYTGSNVYGMRFYGFNSGTQSFGGVQGDWSNPGMNFRQRGQLKQALSMYQFSSGPAYSGATSYVVGNPVTSGGTSYLCIAPTTGNAPPNAAFWRVNPYAGMTVSACPQVVFITDGDEWTASFLTTGISGFPSGINGTGSSSFPLSGTNYRSAQLQFLAWKCAAFPTTAAGVWWSFGINTYPAGAQDTNPICAQLITDTIAAAGTTTYRNFTYSNADFVVNEWNDKAGWTFPRANCFKQGYIGIRSPPTTNPTSGPIVPVPATSSQGLANVMGTFETGDWASQSGPQPPQPPFGANGFASTAAVEACFDELKFMGGTMAQLVTTDDSFTAGVFAGNGASDPWSVAIRPGMVAWIAANATPGNPFGFSNQLPVRWMYGPSITTFSAPTTSSAVINWAPITGQGTFNSASAAGIKLNVIRNGVQYAQVDAAAGTFTDSAAPTGTYTYALQMVNSNGTGPIGATITVNTPLFLFPNFSGSPNIHIGAGGGAVSGGTINFPNASHAGGGVWYGAGVENIQAFSADFTFIIPSAGNYGLVCVFQNSNSTTNPFASGINAGGNSANGIGWGAGGGAGQPAMGNSVGLVFDVSGMNSAFGLPPPFSAVGLYVDGGPGIGSGGFGPANGFASKTDLKPLGFNLGSGHLLHCFITYDGTTFTMVLVDTVAGTATRQSWPVNIPAIVGANTAFIGFCQSQPTTGSGPVTVNSWNWYPGVNTRVATPTFSVPAGQYAGAQSVSLAAPAGATIYYTTDGTPPTTNSTLWSGTPIAVSATQVVNAVAVQQPGYADSPVAQALYRIQAGTQTINLPSGFAGNGGLMQLTGNAHLSGSNIVLTDTTQSGEAAGAWFAAPVPLTNVAGGFSATFAATMTGDGMCFVIQGFPQTNTGTNFNWNLGIGPFGVVTVSGGPLTLSAPNVNGANNLGYTNIFASIAIALTSAGVGLYQNNSGNGVNGVVPSGSQVSCSPVNLVSGASFTGTIVYNGTSLVITLHQGANTFGPFTLSSNINIPLIVGGGVNPVSSGYVGFTAGVAQFGTAAIQVSSLVM